MAILDQYVTDCSESAQDHREARDRAAPELRGPTACAGGVLLVLDVARSVHSRPSMGGNPKAYHRRAETEADRSGSAERKKRKEKVKELLSYIGKSKNNMWAESVKATLSGNVMKEYQAILTGRAHSRSLSGRDV